MDPSLVQSIFLDRHLAYALTDRDLCVVDIQGATHLFREGQRPWRGRPLPELVPELGGLEPILSDLLAGQIPRFELSWVNREKPDGSILYLNLVALPHRDASGQILGLLQIIQDCTDAGELKQRVTQDRNELRLLRERLSRQYVELAVANTELRQLSDLKSQFVSVAAHELRSPLTAIIGFVELLLDGRYGPLSEEQRSSLQTVYASAQRLMDIISNLLDVARIEAGRIDLLLQPLDLSTLVQTVIAEFKPQIEKAALHVSPRVSPDLPSALCDGTRAAQIIGNLLSNAIKYTPSGGDIIISMGHAQTAGFLQVSVADNGVGISKEDQDQLFRRFFRAGSAVRTRASGAGLGLHITRSLVELHGGQIWCESESGQGSTFHVTFPIAD